MALLWMDCEWGAEVGVQCVLEPAMKALMRIAVVGPALREQHRMEAGSNSRWELRPAGSTRWRYHKLTWLVDEVESFVEEEGFSAFVVLRAIEEFGKLGQLQWLKVAGDSKAYLIEATAALRRRRHHEVFAELGCYVGYTAVRLGLLQRREGRDALGVLSMESDAVHAAVGRHILDLARLRPLAEVFCGLLPLVTPRLIEEVGAEGLGFLFMDHRGTHFHREFAHLQQLGLFSGDAHAVVDNCLTPAAPEFCWALTGELRPCAQAWSLKEFDRPQEDWMVVCNLALAAGEMVSECRL